MSVLIRFRDAYRKYVVPWLSDRPGQTSGKTVGFRYLWSMIAPLDAAADVLVQGLQAPWPGVGTPTALPLIGRGRGLIKGEGQSDADFGLSLIPWLDKWRRCGSSEALAQRIHEYLSNHPRVRIVTRGGKWVTVNADGTITTAQQAWNWDGTSHPERSGFWSDLWIIVYPPPWTNTAGTYGDGAVYGSTDGWGHDNTQVEYEAIKNLIATWKSAHSNVRAVIWTTDATLFDPANPSSLPDGTWGAWGTRGSGPRVASGRNTITCRYWEP